MAEPARKNHEVLAHEVGELASLAIESDRPLFALAFYLHEGEKLAFLEAVRRQLSERRIQSRTLDPAHRPDHGIGELYKALARSTSRELSLIGNLPRVSGSHKPDRLFLEYINLHRNLVRERKLRFLLCVHESEAEDFINVAGDLWDVRSRSVWLERSAGVQGEALWQSLSKASGALAVSEGQKHEITEHVARVRKLVAETEAPEDAAAVLHDLVRWLGRRHARRLSIEVALEGLELLSDEPSPLRQKIELNLGWLLFHSAHLPEALAHLERGLEICRQLGDRSAESRALVSIASVYRQWGRYEEALRYLEQSLAITREAHDRTNECLTLNNISQIYNSWDRHEEALEYLKKSLEIAREIGDRTGESVTLNNISRIYQSQGRYEEALELLEQSLTIAREIGDRAGEGVTLNNFSLVYQSRDRLEEALKYLEQSLEIQREIGDQAGESKSLNNLATIHYRWGRYEEALKYFAQSLEIQREIGDLAGEGIATHNLSHTYELRGDLGRAIEFARRTVEIGAETQSPDLDKDRSRMEDLKRRLQQQSPQTANQV